jgi:anthranilate/para-aminobenzoate synthase component I
MRLTDLDELPAFALFGPEWTGGGFLLLEGLQRTEALKDVRVFFQAYEARAPELYTATSEQQVDVRWDAARATLRPLLDLEGYEPQVQAIREAIANGDVYQVNLTRKAQLGAVSGASLAAAQCRNGVPRFFAWVRFPDGRELVSASPERFFSVDGRRVWVEPMKGTAAPGRAEELWQSKKDEAELAMITDLLRNDLAPLCVPKSVRVIEPRRLLRLPYAVQTVSVVEGQLQEPFEPRRVLAALHPGGSVTGTPKLMAMRFIQALEGRPRGAYCGTLGIWRGDQVTASLLIRTAEKELNRWRYGTGSAITWASDAEAEAAELRLKLEALL